MNEAEAYYYWRALLFARWIRMWARKLYPQFDWLFCDESPYDALFGGSDMIKLKAIQIRPAPLWLKERRIYGHLDDEPVCFATTVTLRGVIFYISWGVGEWLMRLLPAPDKKAAIRALLEKGVSRAQSIEDRFPRLVIADAFE